MDKAKPTVFTYFEEYVIIEQLVLAKPEIETGGDLFGLWVNESRVVLQLITGPGGNCKRTKHSFFQDVDYLSRTGNRLIQCEGLCNVGEWHSHHRLGLPQPSGGDQRTVWENMPKLGLPRFVLLIANITGKVKSPKVNVGAFLFDWSNRRMVESDIVKLGGPSVFRSNALVMEVLEHGREKEEDSSDQRGFNVMNIGSLGATVNRNWTGKEAFGQNKTTKLTKNQRKRKRKKNKNKSSNQNEQTNHEPDGNLKRHLEISHGAEDSFGSVNGKISPANKSLQQVQCKDIGTQTQQEPKTVLNNTNKKKRKGGQNSVTPCKKILTHASEILEFTSQLCKDLDDPRFAVQKDSAFDLKFQLRSEVDLSISVSVSRYATGGNTLGEITLGTKDGTVVEQLSSWSLQEEKNKKTVKNLKKKLACMESANTAGVSLRQRFTVDIWKIVQARVMQSNCVIL